MLNSISNGADGLRSSISNSADGLRQSMSANTDKLLNSISTGAGGLRNSISASANDLKQTISTGTDDLLYSMSVGAMRTAARNAPHSVAALRGLCDTQVPAAFLKGAYHMEETVSIADGKAIVFEWVFPSRRKTSSGDSASFLPTLFASTDIASDLEGHKRVMLYAHGGAYVLCTPGSLRGATFPLAGTLDIPLCVPYYRRPPDEGTIADAVEDVLDAYKHLIQRLPQTTEIILGGESAGGGLIATALIKIRDLLEDGDERLRFPTAVFLMSPWVDLGEEGLRNCQSSMANETTDYLPIPMVRWIAKEALGDMDENYWIASPVHAPGSLHILPKIFVLWGQAEVLAGGIRHFCSEWTKKGATIREHVVVDGVHAPVIFAYCHEPSRQGLTATAQFMKTLDGDRSSSTRNVSAIAQSEVQSQQHHDHQAHKLFKPAPRPRPLTTLTTKHHQDHEVERERQERGGNKIQQHVDQQHHQLYEIPTTTTNHQEQDQEAQERNQEHEKHHTQHQDQNVDQQQEQDYKPSQLGQAAPGTKGPITTTTDHQEQDQEVEPESKQEQQHVDLHHNQPREVGPAALRPQPPTQTTTGFQKQQDQGLERLRDEEQEQHQIWTSRGRDQ